MSTDSDLTADVGPVTTWADDVADRLEDGDATVEDAAEAIRDLSGVVADLADDVETLSDRLDDHQSGISYATAMEAQGVLERIQDLEDDAGDDAVQQPTTIQQFAAMPAENRDALGPSDRRAAFLYENFSDWCRMTPKGQLITTNCDDADGRAKIKQLLESTLAAHGYDEGGLAWNEVYRAMRMVARKSGGDDDCVDDGAFTFIDGWSDPWNDSSDTAKVLVLERPELLTGDGHDHTDDDR